MGDIVYRNAGDELKTITDFLRFGYSQANAADLYYGHGTDNAWDDMRSLILGSLHLPHGVDASLFESRLTSDEKKLIADRLYQRIVERMPVPYLINEAWFCDLPFYVDERVLIPRSPIAELIQQQFAPWVNPDEVNYVLDLCTGSACIAIACAYAFPDAQVDAVDLSEDALEVAAMNCAQLGVEDQVHLIHSDCWAEVPLIRYDLIVSNPPYVGADEMESLPDEYRHEPAMALETHNNGLALVDEILAHAHEYLSDNGILVVEVGNSDDALCAAYPDLPFIWLDFERGGHGVFLLSAETLREYWTKKRA